MSLKETCHSLEQSHYFMHNFKWSDKTPEKHEYKVNGTAKGGNSGAKKKEGLSIT